MILTVIGARPQFVKAAAVSKALKEIGIDETIIHTGQHYDDIMSGVFWRDLGLPKVFANLEVGSNIQGKQTAEIIEKVEQLIIELQPSAVMVYGDTNSTLGAAIATSKFPELKLIHIEAGLRSFNRSMPEEINRIVTDHLSHYLFCSSPKGVEQLLDEGISSNVFDVGDVMHDSIKLFSPVVEKLPDTVSNKWINNGPFAVMTIHRPSNTDDYTNLSSIISAIEKIDTQVIWPVHPRNKNVLNNIKLPSNLKVVEPVSYFDMLNLLKHCSCVITDSGGLQKEAYWMKRKCITVREETEWIETMKFNANQVTGPFAEKIVNAFYDKTCINWDENLYGDGTASVKIANILMNVLHKK